jgi:thiol-disulfide isomerase/thioredoxin
MSHRPAIHIALTAAALACAAPAFAQDPIGFFERPILTIEANQFSDREVSSLLTTLDALLGDQRDEGDTAAQRAATDKHLADFVRQLQRGRLASVQELRVVRHLDALAMARPADSPAIAGVRRMVTTFLPGKVAPDIVGPDLDGQTFRLSDHRGKVVVLLFSAEWCGICRTLNPYERLMQDLYKNWPFSILSVETGSSPAVMKQRKADESLRYRSWWDARSEYGGRGPIASAWNVAGYPAIYVLDGQGVIRFVDVRYEDLLKAVRQLVSERTSTATVGG